jgi:hypothetical protein
MEDVVLRTELDDSTSLYVSPLSRQTYDEHIEHDNLGGAQGYFVVRSRSSGENRLEILAKAPTFEAAEALFDLIAARR